MNRSVALTCAVALAGILSVSGIVRDASAQETYPARAVTIIVPYSPGGSTDVLARMVARSLGESFGQPVIIDNRPGASGNVGLAAGARAVPDGHTLLLTVSSMTTNAAVLTDQPVDPVKALAPIAKFAVGPMILVVNNNFPARTPAELVAELKASPGKYNYASTGTGGASHLLGEMMLGITGATATHVPYKGVAPAVLDVISNRVQLLFTTGPSVTSQLRAGQLRAIGTTFTQASPTTGNLPSLGTALPGLSYAGWWGLFAPIATPEAVVRRLNAEVNRLVALPSVLETCAREGVECITSKPEEFAALIASEIAQFKKLARERGIKAD